MTNTSEGLGFSWLVSAIRALDKHLADRAGRAVNVSLTLRNWLIGAHIAEYELHGADRATYGDGLLRELSKRLSDLKVSNCNRRQLYRYLRFYRLFPEIVGTLSPQLHLLHSPTVFPSAIFRADAKSGRCVTPPGHHQPPETAKRDRVAKRDRAIERQCQACPKCLSCATCAMPGPQVPRRRCRW